MIHTCNGSRMDTTAVICCSSHGCGAREELCGQGQGAESVWGGVLPLPTTTTTTTLSSPLWGISLLRGLAQATGFWGGVLGRARRCDRGDRVHRSQCSSCFPLQEKHKTVRGSAGGGACSVLCTSPPTRAQFLALPGESALVAVLSGAAARADSLGWVVGFLAGR